MTDQNNKDFVTICKSFDHAMLVTRSVNGHLAARPMVIAEFDDEKHIVWFATDANSGKVEDIHSEPNICVTMSGGGNYVSISGNAKIIVDDAQVERLWEEPWRVWFPKGPTDPNLVLIRMDIHAGEFWSNAGLNRISYLIKAAQAYLSGERPSTNDSLHAKVTL